MKPYRQIPIVECGEPLCPIPPTWFARVQPHPYEQLGAPYGDRSPFYLRETVLHRLNQAQMALQEQCPGWQLQIFDAYRPITVQQFMVDYTFQTQVKARGLAVATLTAAQRQAILATVYEFWAVPSPDPATPPPHSTGAAVDLTLLDDQGRVVDMGSAIDEISPRSYPDYFASSDRPSEQIYHQHRQILSKVMRGAGFQQHPHEWWHFSWGDQLWAWLTNQSNPSTTAIARYGAI